jgi:nucleotidyltransferase substrate binding protein (TIGR01987 family)
LSALQSSFDAALVRLEDVLSKPKDEYMRDSAIQRFEFSFELFWKTLKARLEVEGIRVVSPREAIREGFRTGLVPDDDAVFPMLEDRNLSSHTYNEEHAEALYARLPGHCDYMRRCFTKITQ